VVRKRKIFVSTLIITYASNHPDIRPRGQILPLVEMSNTHNIT